MARWWFLRVFSNSSTFSAIFLSTSWRTCPSSSWALKTLFSSCSSAASASSRAAWSSSFSTSRRLLCLSSSWMERPPSPSWSSKSLISSARFLFSLLTTSSCSTVSSQAAFNLGFPFSNNLVKVPASLLSDDGSSMDSLIFQLDVLKFSLKTMLGLFSAGNLLVQAFNGLFSLSKTSIELLPAAVKLINAAKSFSLKLGFPKLDFSLSLGESFEGIRFLFRLLLNTLLQLFQLTVQVFEPRKKGSPVTSLRVSKALGILKLSCKRNLVLSQRSNSILHFINLSEKILVLNLQFLLGR